MVEAINLLGTQYGVLGNHDFDFGIEVLKERLAGSKTVWFLSNIVDPKTKKPLGGVQRSAVFEWKGVKIGIFGVAENWLTCKIYQQIF